jgi:two-component system cell cycle sensor histidine kinase/response regulator CckA
MKILHLEDNPHDAALVRDLLAIDWPDCEIKVVAARDEFLGALAAGGHDLIISDYRLPGFDGLEALQLARERAPHIPFIFYSGTLGEERAIEAVRAGAADYVIKDRMQRLPVAVQRVLRDAADQRARARVEEALAQEQYLLRMLMDNVPDHVYFKDAQSRFIAVSRSLALRHGREPAELKGCSDADLFGPEHASRARADEERIMATGVPLLDHVEQEIWRDGRVAWVSSSKLPLRDASGQIIGTFGVTRDITERRRQDEALRLFRTLVDRSNDAFEVVDPETGRFLDVSERGCSDLGYTREELLKLNVYDVDDSLSRAEWSQRVAAVRRSSGYSIEGQHRRKNGEVYPVEVNARIVTLDREYLVAVVRDVTEKKKLEEQFLRAQRLESLGMLSAGIAHDLNNILAPVLMGAPLLRLRATQPSELRILDTIEASAARGAGLVKQILSFAHGAAGGRIVLQPKHLLRDISALIQQTFPKNITLEEEIPNDLWTVEGNPTQLHQVLLNLCVNARDAMPRGGTLRLRAANRDVDAAAAQAGDPGTPGRHVMFEISDTGTGIPAEILERIWEPFFTTKAAGKGTGLGLATVRGIVARHGGFVQVESEVGRGTTFRVFVPAGEPAAPTRAATTTLATERQGKGELVLVVDDEESIRHVANATLHRFGYRVLTAANGNEAMALYAPRAAEIDLVITDLSMPEMGGGELALALSQINPGVRVLFMSGAAVDPEEKLPPDARILMKPFNVDSLITSVADIIAGRPAS